MRTERSIVRGSRPSQQGFAVFVVIVLLMMMVALAAANTATLNWLRHQVRIVEQRQTQRLGWASTNALPAALSVTNQPPTK